MAGNLVPVLCCTGASDNFLLLLLLFVDVSGYYVTNMGLHLQLSWAAALLFGGNYLRVMAAVIFAAGPLLTEWLMWPVGLEGRRLEWPATWCLYSIALVGFTEWHATQRLLLYSTSSSVTVAVLRVI